MPAIGSSISHRPWSWACSMSRQIPSPTAAAIADRAAALAHARRMIAEGAGIIDIGGESTRPGAQAAELARGARARHPGHRRSAARVRRVHFGGHQQARGDARRGCRRRRHHQRRARPGGGRCARGSRGERGGHLPHAHAGRATHHAGRPALRERGRGGQCLSRRPHARLPRCGDRSRAHQRRSGFRLRKTRGRQPRAAQTSCEPGGAGRAHCRRAVTQVDAGDADRAGGRRTPGRQCRARRHCGSARSAYRARARCGGHRGRGARRGRGDQGRSKGEHRWDASISAPMEFADGLANIR